VPVKHAVATLDGTGEISVTAPTPPPQDGCPLTTDVRVFTYNSAGAAANTPFFLLLN
jgi:hypothetical protein